MNMRLPTLKSEKGWKDPPIDQPGLYWIAFYDGRDWSLRGVIELARRSSTKTGRFLRGLYGRWLDNAERSAQVNLRGQMWKWRQVGIPVIPSDWTRRIKHVGPGEVIYMDVEPKEPQK